MKKIVILLFCIVSYSMQAQDISVKGRVISSEDREGIVGVNVAVKGSGLGVITDINGDYSINVPSEKSVLKFSFLGFTTEEITIGKRTTIDVVLKPDVSLLGEVVVVGFGEQKKASVVGAVSNMRNNDLKRAAPSNLTAAIGGRVTGALVRLGDGNVGGADARYSAGELDNASIFIRGRATTNTATPLILVDGIESTFSRINPEDVEQFSILKDAAATAIYGVRGANGVILITTKQGTVGKPKVSLNAQVRRHSPLKFPHPLNAYENALLRNEAARNVGSTEPYSEEAIEHWRLGDEPYKYPYVDWYKELVKDYFMEDQLIATISGGTEAVKYYVSTEYDYAGGPWKAPSVNENRYKRYNLRTNFDFKISSTTDLSAKLNGRMENRGDANYGESTGQRYYGSFWYGILSSSPLIAPIYNPNGTYAYGNANKWNLRAVLNEVGPRVRYSNALDANFNLKQKLNFILPGLSARLMYASTFSAGSRVVVNPEDAPELWEYNAFTDTYTKKLSKTAPSYGHDNTNLPYARRTQIEAALNYDRYFAEKHHVTAMAVYMQTKAESDAGLPIAHQGISGRLTYDFQGKYLAEVNMGYNGSDQFDKNHRYALFPSASAGWVLSEESFMKNNVPFISFMKLRGSYGLAGNDKIGTDRFLYRYEFNNTGGRWMAYGNEIYNFGIDPVQQFGMREGTLGNDRITWEISKKANAGLDLHLWKNRIKFTTDLFQEKRENILRNSRGDIPSQTGLIGRTPPQNVGRVTNRGYEFELSYSHNFGDFDFSIGGNYTFARNNIDYIAEVDLKYDWMMQKNHSVGQPRGYVWKGKFYEKEDLTNDLVPKPAGTVIPGDLRFEDLNNDGIIDDYDRAYDREAVGYSTIPEIIYGINLGLGYKDFYLDVFFQGSDHLSSRYTNELRYEFYAGNVLPFHLDRWVYDKDRGLDTRATAKYPSLSPGGSVWTQQNSTFQQLNSAFIRLKTIELGYNVPKKLLSKYYMSALRIFLSGSNLLTFDKIGFVDPEYNPESTGQRGNAYPQTKFYAVGLNVSF